MDFKEITKKQMEAERFLLQSFRERFEKCPPGCLACKPDRTGRPQYYHKLPGDPKPHYLNRTMTPLLHELQYKRILQESIKRLEQNLKAREKYLKAYAPFDYSSICKQLPKAYRNADIPYEDADLWTTLQETLQGTSQQTLQPTGTPRGNDAALSSQRNLPAKKPDYSYGRPRRFFPCRQHIADHRRCPGSPLHQVFFLSAHQCDFTKSTPPTLTARPAPLALSTPERY